jgi:hypothetical protein
MFENRELSRIFGPKREAVRGGCRRIMRNFTTCTRHQILLGSSNKGG